MAKKCARTFSIVVEKRQKIDSRRQALAACRYSQVRAPEVRPRSNTKTVPPGDAAALRRARGAPRRRLARAQSI